MRNMNRQRQTILILACTLLGVFLINYSIQTLDEVPSLSELPRPDFNLSLDLPDFDIPTNPDQTSLDLPDIDLGNLDPEPLLEILGKTNTEYLRLQTYDDYFNGIWDTALTNSVSYDGESLDFDIDLWTEFDQNTITIKPFTDTGGYLPTPQNPLLINLSDPARFFEDSQIFQVQNVPESYEIEYILYNFSEAMMNASSVELIPQYLDIPDYLESDIKALAEAITQDSTTDYESIIALEQYLENYYEYNLSCPEPPPGTDPLEYFLYESGQGVCSHFNTALVMLSRSLGISARLVGGYYIDPLADQQLVYPIQSHAFTEIPFNDLGWLIFDATPGAQIQDMINEIPELNLTNIEDMFVNLNFTYPDARLNITQERLFSIYGKTGSQYLRDGTCEYYNGSWYQPVSLPIEYTGQMIEETHTEYETSTGYSYIIDPSSTITGYIPGPQNPTQLELDANVSYYPDFKLFLSEAPISTSYKISSIEYTLSQKTLETTTVQTTTPYLQIEETLKDQLQTLTTQITADKSSDYSKIDAIAEYLRTEYTYNLTAASAPEDMDQIIWFLLHEQGGICTDFASALTMMTRSINIPSRLVTGYLVNPDVEVQDVSPFQAHAYTEVLFDDLGWLLFDATPTTSPQINKTTGKTPTFTNITHQDATVTVGGEFTVTGTVVDENAIGVEGLDVLIYLKRDKDESGVLSGQGIVTNGQFNITCIFPTNLPNGEYMVDAHTIGDNTYMDSWSDPPLTAFSETNFIIKAPEKVISGRQYSVNATLVDNKTNQTITDALCIIAIGDGEYTLITDESGKITFYTVSDPGNVNITLSWEGIQYTYGAENSVTIRSIPLQIAIPPETVLVRGERSTIRGQVRAEDIPGSSESISMTLLGEHTVSVSNEYGEFYIERTLSNSTELGTAPLLFEVQSNHETLETYAIVKARTTLTMQTQDSGQVGTKTDITVSLSDDTRKPLGESPIEFSYSIQNQTFTETAVTDSDGKAVIKIPLPDKTGSINVKASYPGQGYMLSSSANKSITVIKNTKFPIIQLTAVVLLIGGLAGLFYYLNQRKSHKIEIEDIELVNQVQSDRLRIILPNIESDLPAVWGINESITIHGLMLNEEKTPSTGETLTLLLNETELTSAKTDSNGKITYTQTFVVKGIHRLKLLHEEEGLRTNLDIKIVEYRDEIIRLFNNRFQEARERFQSIQDNYTARELYLYLSNETPELSHEPLRELVFIFEEANYSLHEVNREQYTRFFKAMRTYKEAIDGKDG
ncbi:hypothetical protein HN807_02395 [Candidatus Bathyarchaeota archaeon]|nr:hypothetical protein [Candidatus Bathyarchaeota archaeon]MBT7187029.1 hypothetical protein [Candidatus Bathyarchaeota archaeon]MBT7345916.1 hypothetical protein [Candidatus Bathyarchaeota archaeon]